MSSTEPAHQADPDALVDAARKGDAQALTAIWSTYAPTVYGYLRKQGARDPEDLTSDVFLAVFDRIRRFKGGDAQLRAFLFTVAHHRLIDERRRSARQPATAPYEPGSDVREADSAETEALTTLATRRVRELMDSLPPDQRDVMLLRIVGDLSLEQTAAALGKRVGAVKAAQHRALLRLRSVVREAATP